MYIECLVYENHRNILINFFIKNFLLTFLENSNNFLASCLYNSPQLKDIIIEEKTPTNGFPPPPSPTTLHRSTNATSSVQNTSVIDPRLDINFSSVIAQRAAASKARRHENIIELEYNSIGLPPSKTFFNSCITSNGNLTNSKLYY